MGWGLRGWGVVLWKKRTDYMYHSEMTLQESERALNAGSRHVEQLFCQLFCQLPRTGKMCSFLTRDAANKLAVSLILPQLDYCNSLLAGIPGNKLNKLQLIQNHAAQRVLCKSRHASVCVPRSDGPCWLHATWTVEYEQHSPLSSRNALVTCTASAVSLVS